MPDATSTSRSGSGPGRPRSFVEEPRRGGRLPARTRPTVRCARSRARRSGTPACIDAPGTDHPLALDVSPDPDPERAVREDAGSAQGQLVGLDARSQLGELSRECGHHAVRLIAVEGRREVPGFARRPAHRLRQPRRCTTDRAEGDVEVVEHVLGRPDRGEQSSPLRPCAGVQADRRGGGQVERLGPAPDGDAHDGVGQGTVLVAQPPRLVAEEPRRRADPGPARRPRSSRRRRGDRRGRSPAPSAARISRPASRRWSIVAARSAPVIHREVEQGACRRPHDLRVVHVHALAGQHGSVSPRGIRGADHRSGVPGVAHVHQDRDQPRRPRAPRACAP